MRLLFTLLFACASVPVRAQAVVPLRVENRWLRLEIDPAGASVLLIDKGTGSKWTLGSPQLVLQDNRTLAVSPVRNPSADGSRLCFSSDDGTSFELRLEAGFPSAVYSFHSGSNVKEVRILNHALPIGPGEQNYYAVPVRLGLLFRPEGTEPFSRTYAGYSTSQGYSMAMFGAVQNGSALLISWSDPYTRIQLDYSGALGNRLTMGLSLRASATSIRFQPLGRGGYVEIAKAYRKVAKQMGFLKTFSEKIKENPAVERLFGAADFKPFIFTRYVPNTRWNKSDKEVLRIGFTFEEAARLAEHFHNDLGIDRALFVLAGWINGGYDNRHPDILPAAPEIGGERGLAECSRRVRALPGFVFGLHDNYQDMYKDAPSWNEEFIMKNRDGSLHEGGVWAGGRAYLICSKKSLELAMRPQNIPRVLELFSPDVYFYDTIFAAPLYECFDPKHPLDMVEDMHAKQNICATIRKAVGLFGSEEGKEWGVPYGDYFEGMMSQRTGFSGPPDPRAAIIPLFELVYGDAILLYTHQSDHSKPDNPAYILDHVLYAEMPVYYFGQHLYWTDPAQDFHAPQAGAPSMIFAQGGHFNLIDQFIKNTYEVLSPLSRITALMEMTDHRFLTADRKVETTRFGAGVSITVNYGPADFTTNSTVLPQYGFLVQSPTFVAFYAKTYRGLQYREPALFVIRSLDGKPLSTSRRVRFYHGFGDRRVLWRGKVIQVETERILTPRSE